MDGNVKFYPKPEEPTWCCGRGCENCVLIDYYHALKRWEELFSKQEINIAI